MSTDGLREAAAWALGYIADPEGLADEKEHVQARLRTALAAESLASVPTDVPGLRAEIAGAASMPLPWDGHQQKLALHALRAALAASPDAPRLTPDRHVWRTKTSIRDGSPHGRFVVDWTEAEEALDAAPRLTPDREALARAYAIGHRDGGNGVLSRLAASQPVPTEPTRCGHYAYWNSDGVCVECDKPYPEPVPTEPEEAARCVCGAEPPRRPWTEGAGDDPCRDGNGNFRLGHEYGTPDREALDDKRTLVSLVGRYPALAIGTAIGYCVRDHDHCAASHPVPTEPEETPVDLTYDAWTVIANAMDRIDDPEWTAAATRWRDEWHKTLTPPPTEPEEADR